MIFYVLSYWHGPELIQLIVYQIKKKFIEQKANKNWNHGT